MTVKMNPRNWELTSRGRELVEEWRTNLPDILYRYMRLSDGRRRWLEEIVSDSKLYFPNYHELNDPFDSDCSISFEAAPEMIEAYFQHVVPQDMPNRDQVIQNAIQTIASPEAQERTNKAVRDEMAKSGVGCFVRRPDHLLMWSYYADGHKGVCLRFNADHLFDAYCRTSGLLLPVQYGPTRPTIPYFTTGHVEMSYAVMGTKAEQWKHEDEWRIVLPKRSGHVPMPPEALESIILGIATTPRDELFIRNLVKRTKRPIGIFKATKLDRAYGVHVENLGKPSSA